MSQWPYMTLPNLKVGRLWYLILVEFLFPCVLFLLTKVDKKLISFFHSFPFCNLRYAGTCTCNVSLCYKHVQCITVTLSWVYVQLIAWLYMNMYMHLPSILHTCNLQMTVNVLKQFNYSSLLFRKSRVNREHLCMIQTIDSNL